MDEDMREMQEPGETAEVPVTASASGEMETVLVFLTSIFLVLGILLIMTQLYSVYGLGKTEGKFDRIRSEQK